MSRGLPIQFVLSHRRVKNLLTRQIRNWIKPAAAPRVAAEQSRTGQPSSLADSVTLDCLLRIAGARWLKPASHEAAACQNRRQSSLVGVNGKDRAVGAADARKSGHY